MAIAEAVAGPMMPLGAACVLNARARDGARRSGAAGGGIRGEGTFERP